MKKLIRILSLVICLTVVLPVAFGCADSGKTEDTTAAAQDTAALSEGSGAEAVVTESDKFDGLNFDRTFTYYAWKQSILEYEGDDNTGDLIESAIFKRNLHVSEKLGVEFEFIYESGSSTSFKEFCQKAETNIKSNAQAYDGIACYTRSASLLMTSGLLQDMLGNEYLDFSADCWPESLINLNTIGGKLYFASGDIATSLLYQMMFMAINNDVAKDRDISGVQEKALAGEWTLDYMLEICRDGYNDLDPIGSRDPSDGYGLFTVTHPMLDVFYIGAGLKYVELVNGEPQISNSLNSDVSLDIIDKLQNLFFTSKDGYFHTSSDQSTYMKNGTSLLYVLNGTWLQSRLNVADFDYSILCAPKYNSDQTAYYTAVGFPHSMYCIPFDASDATMSGAVIQLSAIESKKEVTPVVFDTSFKYRYSNGVGDVEMFDIIRDGVVFDLGRTFFDQLGGDDNSPIRLWRNDVYQNTKNLGKNTKQFASKWKKNLENTIATIIAQGH